MSPRSQRRTGAFGTDPVPADRAAGRCRHSAPHRAAPVRETRTPKRFAPRFGPAYPPGWPPPQTDIEGFCPAGHPTPSQPVDGHSLAPVTETGLGRARTLHECEQTGRARGCRGRSIVEAHALPPCSFSAAAQECVPPSDTVTCQPTRPSGDSHFLSSPWLVSSFLRLQKLRLLMLKFIFRC